VGRVQHLVLRRRDQQRGNARDGEEYRDEQQRQAEPEGDGRVVADELFHAGRSGPGGLGAWQSERESIPAGLRGRLVAREDTEIAGEPLLRLADSAHPRYVVEPEVRTAKHPFRHGFFKRNLEQCRRVFLAYREIAQTASAQSAVLAQTGDAVVGSDTSFARL